jgi:tetrahydromethanopterin S-methyltransferase subunit E
MPKMNAVKYWIAGQPASCQALQATMSKGVLNMVENGSIEQVIAFQLGASIRRIIGALFAIAVRAGRPLISGSRMEVSMSMHEVPRVVVAQEITNAR